MTVAALIGALSEMPPDALVACEGTSIAVFPESVVRLSDYRREQIAEGFDAWPFESYDGDTTVVLRTQI